MNVLRWISVTYFASSITIVFYNFLLTLLSVRIFVEVHDLNEDRVVIIMVWMLAARA